MHDGDDDGSAYDDDDGCPETIETVTRQHELITTTAAKNTAVTDMTLYAQTGPTAAAAATSTTAGHDVIDSNEMENNVITLSAKGHGSGQESSFPLVTRSAEEMEDGHRQAPILLNASLSAAIIPISTQTTDDKVCLQPQPEQSQPHPQPPSTLLPSGPQPPAQPQAPLSSVRSGKRGNVRQTHAMARLAAPVKAKAIPPSGGQGQQQLQPQQRPQQQPQLRAQPPSKSGIRPSQPQPHTKPTVQRRRSYVVVTTNEQSAGAGIGEGAIVEQEGGEVDVDVSSTAIHPSSIPPINNLSETRPQPQQPPPIESNHPTMATDTSTPGVPQMVPTMQSTEQPSEHIRIPVSGQNMQKQKVSNRHTMKKRQVNTSAPAATAATAAAAEGVSTIQPSILLHKPQPPTKPKSGGGRVSTSRQPPISITIAAIPSQPIMSPLQSSPLQSSPKKSPSQNVLPGEQRRLQLENRLQLIKREAAIRRRLQHNQTQAQAPQPSPQPSPQQQQYQNQEDNGAEYFTQVPSNEAIQYYSEIQSIDGVGSQVAPAQDGDESVETITMSVC